MGDTKHVVLNSTDNRRNTNEFNIRLPCKDLHDLFSTALCCSFKIFQVNFTAPFPLSKWQLIDAADLGWGKSAFGRTCWNILIWMKVFVTYDMSQLFEPAMTYKRSQIVGSQANSQRTHCSEAANIWGGLVTYLAGLQSAGAENTTIGHEIPNKIKHFFRHWSAQSA